MLRYYLQCSQTWLPTVQEVLQADWQEAGHSPQPPVRRVLFSIALLTVLMCLRIVITSKNIIWLLNLFYRFLRHLARPFYRLIYLSLRIQPNSCFIATQTNHCSADAEDNVRNNLQNSAIPDNRPKRNRCIDNMI